MKRPVNGGEIQIFSGLLKCADCGAGLRYWISQAHEKDDGELLRRLLKSGDKQRARENASAEKELTRVQKRLQELDNLFVKMYEDIAREAITERNFTMLSAKYQEEQAQLEETEQALQVKLEKSAQDADGAEKWLVLSSESPPNSQN